MSLLPSHVEALYEKSSSDLQWVEAIFTVMQDYCFENTWQVERGASRRVVFVYDSTFAITWGQLPSSSSSFLQVWYNNSAWVGKVSSLPSLPCPIVTSFPIPWDDETKTWKFETDSFTKIVEVINAGFKACTLGEVVLGLPWEGFMNEEATEVVADSIPSCKGGSFLEEANNLPDDVIDSIKENLKDLYGSDDFRTTCASYVFAALQQNYPLVFPAKWGSVETQTSYGDDWLPPYSPLSFFYEFVAEVEEIPNTFVLWDECCSACASGTRLNLQDSGEFNNDSEDIVLWGQNSQYQYLADGSVCSNLYTNSEEIVELFEKYNITGLDLG